MSTQTSSRPVGVDELKRAWNAVTAGEFRAGVGVGKGPRGRGTAAADDWSPAHGEHTIAVIGCAGSVGASTVALAAGLAAAGPVRVIECCSVTASGLAAASTAELGLHPTDWRQGKRDHVLLERASEVLAGVDEVPLPIDAENQTQLTILDVGWEAGQLLANDWQPEQVALAVRGPRRKKWPRGLEHAGGPAVRRALVADRCVEIPEDRELEVNGLDSRPVPAPLISAARQLLEPAHLPTDTSESA